MKQIIPYSLSILSGVILFAGIESPFSLILMLVAYVPLLYAEYYVARKPGNRMYLNVFVIAFASFFVADMLALYPFVRLLEYWIVIYAFGAALVASVVFLLFSIVKKKLGGFWGYSAWVVFMVVLEYLSLNTVFSFPCMQVGVLAFTAGNTALFQWYEYTGVLGGSLWMLLCNLFLFLSLKKYIDTKAFRSVVKPLLTFGLCVGVPILISLAMYAGYTEEENPVEVLVVQPNIDPYTEKFTEDPMVQLDGMLEQAKAQMTDNTEYVVLPETALQGNLWFNNIEESEVVQMIRDSLLCGYPKAKLIAGADMMQYYVVHDGKAPTPTAKKAEDKVYYDFFNVAVQVDSEGKVQVYKKSKLVLGTEYVPLVQQFPQMERWVMDLGGSAQSRGRQEAPSLLVSESGSVASVICFESLFGEYVSEFVKIGADLICIISNDGWWDEHPIPLRHVRFAQLRAIENRRSVIRCANTGISCFIDQRGDLYETSDWWTEANVLGTVNKNNDMTFYSRHGDYVGRASIIFSVLILLLLLSKMLRGRIEK